MTTPTNRPRPDVRISPLAPAYYLGRPAHVWVEALGPRRRTTGISAAGPTPIDNIDASEQRIPVEQSPACLDDLLFSRRQAGPSGLVA
jgi:hypothetical protein